LLSPDLRTFKGGVIEEGKDAGSSAGSLGERRAVLREGVGDRRVNELYQKEALIGRRRAATGMRRAASGHSLAQDLESIHMQ
jgi:hypothetical protein